VSVSRPKASAARPRARFAGTRLGKYQVGARLAAGGTASVYIARIHGPHNFERLVALKIVHDHLSEEQEFVSMFLDEANLASQLSHPGIVHVYELAREGDVLFLAMEYLHGQTLSHVYRRAVERAERLPLDVVAWIGARAAEALAHAHELKDASGQRVGLVHRDVSPQNIFVTYDGHVKVVDFGIARAEGRIAKTALGQIKGKFSYMAPEQALGQGFDHRADLFALGATLYEVAVGQRLFKGEDEIDTLRKVVSSEIPHPASLVPGFPAALTAVLKRSLERNPGDRYSTGLEMARELDAFVAASGLRDQSERLAQELADLFVEERAAQEGAIADLRRAALEPAGQSDVASTGEDTVIATGMEARPELRRRPSLALVVGGVVALGGTIALLGLASRRASPEVAPAVAAPVVAPAPKSDRVAIAVTWRPDVQARLEIAGQLVTARPARMEVKRGVQEVRVVVSAAGFKEAEVKVVPDRDRDVVVALEPAQADAGAAAAKARFAPARPPAGAPKPPMAPPTKLIKKNPFD
jgi:serine/threonine-protein kinase